MLAFSFVMRADDDDDDDDDDGVFFARVRACLRAFF
jgi:hypothetical protein